MLTIDKMEFLFHLIVLIEWYTGNYVTMLTEVYITGPISDELFFTLVCPEINCD